ncbi:MAG: hypothetical protein LBE01_00445 [Deltaproteobacteria bacterium]|jgi:hypothetical protein|nr:hypothetical protein [Deltaproteobacteria bacterium]
MKQLREPPIINSKRKAKPKAYFRIVTRQGDEYDFPHGVFNARQVPCPTVNDEQIRDWKIALDFPTVQQQSFSDEGSLEVSVEYLESLLKETLRHRNVTKCPLISGVWKEMEVEDTQLLMIIEKGNFTVESTLYAMVVYLLKDYGEPLEAINLAGPRWVFGRNGEYKYFPATKRVVTVKKDWRALNPNEIGRREARPLKKSVKLTLVK